MTAAQDVHIDLMHGDGGGGINTKYSRGVRYMYLSPDDIIHQRSRQGSKFGDYTLAARVSTQSGAVNN